MRYEGDRIVVQFATEGCQALPTVRKKGLLT